MSLELELTHRQTAVDRVIGQVPIIHSFKRFLKGANVKMVCNYRSEQYIKNFNNKDVFIYRDSNKMGSEREFYQAVALLEKSITYFTQSWSRWSRMHSNNNLKRNSILLSYNAVIYAYIKTDNDKIITFAYICELLDVNDFEEAESTIHECILDTVIDMFCQSICHDWDVMAVVPAFGFKKRLPIKVKI